MDIDLSRPLQTGVLYALGFLLTATIFTYLLRLRFPESETIRKVLRIIGGWWTIAGVLVFALVQGFKGLVFIFLIVSLLGLKEYLSVLRSKFINLPVMAALSLLTVVHYGFILLNWKNFFLFIVPVMAFVFLPFFFLIRRRAEGLVVSLWATQSGIMLCVYFLSFVPGLAFLNNNETALRRIDPLAAFLFLFLVTELNDVFQFLSGKLFGRTRIVPELSPNKTLEGFAGGMFLSICLSLFLAPFFLEVELWQAAVLGAALSLSGMSGDLMFSAVKRTYGVKDFSNLIPGHGGALDRVDSMVFTAPTLYCLLYLFIH